MSQQTTDLLAAAARDILEPLGMRRKGRTRTWLDDRGWWAGVVDFQASQWEDRSYLNVGVHWLWDVGGGQVHINVGGQFGGRVGRELPPPDEREDPTDVAEFVRAAADHALPYRERFSTVTDAAAHLRDAVAPAHWRDAGIALGLVGDREAASSMFDRFTGWFEDASDFVQSNTFFVAKYEQACTLGASLGDPPRFRELVHAAIEAERRRLRLRRVDLRLALA
jgi:hypothetical protein